MTFDKGSYSLVNLIFSIFPSAPQECPPGNTNCPLKDSHPIGFNAQGEVCKSSGKQFRWNYSQGRNARLESIVKKGYP